MKDPRRGGRRRLAAALAAGLVLAPAAVASAATRASITVVPAAPFFAQWTMPAVCVLGAVLAVVVLVLAFGGRPKSSKGLAGR